MAIKNPFATENSWSKNLTKVEQRALAYAEYLKDVLESGKEQVTILVTWKKSKTWGLCPSISNQMQEKVAHASGCGYCKLSACLVELLRFFADDTEQYKDIYSQGGCGEYAVFDAMDRVGYTVKRIHNGKNEEVFGISKKLS